MCNSGALSTVQCCTTINTIQFQNFLSTSNRNRIPIKAFDCEWTSSFDSFCDLLQRTELEFEHGQDQQPVLFDDWPVLEGPVAEKKNWGMKRNKEKRNRDIWGCDGGRESSPQRSQDCTLSKVTPQLTATVWALRVGRGLRPQSTVCCLDWRLPDYLP